MFEIVSISLFVLGAIIASFIGVLAGRLNTGQSILSGRSRCDACNSNLSPLVLVPVVSYLTTRGRAVCCGARISILAPVTELLLGVLFVLSYQMLDMSLALMFVLISLSLLLALVLYDLAHQILPPSLLTIFVVSSALAGFFSAQQIAIFYEHVIAAVLISGSLLLAHYISRGRAMGFSDAPLALGLSLLTAPYAFPGFVFSFWIGAVVGIVMLARRPRGSRMGVEVPFAPFLAAGFLLSYFTQWNPFNYIAGIL